MAGSATLISLTTVPTGSGLAPRWVVRWEVCERVCFATESFISLTPVRTRLTYAHTKVFNERIHNVANLGQGLLNTLSDWMTPADLLSCDLWLAAALIRLRSKRPALSETLKGFVFMSALVQAF